MFEKHKSLNIKAFFVLGVKDILLTWYINLIFKGQSVIKHFVPFQMDILGASCMEKNLQYFLNFIRIFQVNLKDMTRASLMSLETVFPLCACIL